MKVNMDKKALKETAEYLVQSGKGILAADESSGTIKKRFDVVGIEDTEENHRKYRQLLFTTQNIENYISGVIMYDETIRQKADDGKSFPELLSVRGMYPGIKVDTGKVSMPLSPDEWVTEGLDGLRSRLKEYKDLGVKFAKWRAVIVINGDYAPSAGCLNSNIDSLARYAGYCQEVGIVPIVEPEVLMDGDHDLKRCADVTTRTLKSLFAELFDHQVYLDGLVLKINMILPGKKNDQKFSDEEVAKETLKIMESAVSVSIPGIVFLSGGQTPQESTSRLNKMNKIGAMSWAISFSYGRALQETVLSKWEGKDENIEAAQNEFLKRSRLNSLATKGEYESSMETE